MSVLRNFTEWVLNNGDVAGPGTLVSDWKDAGDLNGCQFYIKYTNAATVNVTVEVSAIGATDARQHDRDDFSQTAISVEAGAAAAGHFVDPPTVMDRPFGSYRVTVASTDNAIEALYVLVCRNSGD